jgi:hypothetical protein
LKSTTVVNFKPATSNLLDQGIAASLRQALSYDNSSNNKLYMKYTPFSTSNFEPGTSNLIAAKVSREEDRVTYFIVPEPPA